MISVLFEDGDSCYLGVGSAIHGVNKFEVRYAAHTAVMSENVHIVHQGSRDQSRLWS